ncbi:MAG: hypothetical protein ABII22_03395 [Candidatus Micrarchaeota archaeon]
MASAVAHSLTSAGSARSRTGEHATRSPLNESIIKPFSSQDIRALLGVRGIYEGPFNGPVYDHVMRVTGHYDALEYLARHFILSTLDFPIVDLGCGTAHLLAYLIRSGNGEVKRKLMGFVAAHPHTPAIVALDVDATTMLRQSGTNLTTSLECAGYPASWIGENPDVHKVVLVSSSIEDVYLNRMDWLLNTPAQFLFMTYVNHWIGGGRVEDESISEFRSRTLQAKFRAAQIASMICAEGGQLFSAEEFKLVVSPATERSIPGLNELVHKNTSPINKSKLYDLFAQAGFDLNESPNSKAIDSQHDMTGAVFRLKEKRKFSDLSVVL